MGFDCILGHLLCGLEEKEEGIVVCIFLYCLSDIDNA